MDTKIVVYNIPLYNGISLSNKKKQTTDTSRNLDGYQKYDAAWRKKDTKSTYCKIPLKLPGTRLVYGIDCKGANATFWSDRDV